MFGTRSSAKFRCQRKVASKTQQLSDAEQTLLNLYARIVECDVAGRPARALQEQIYVRHVYQITLLRLKCRFL